MVYIQKIKPHLRATQSGIVPVKGHYRAMGGYIPIRGIIPFSYGKGRKRYRRGGDISEASFAGQTAPVIVSTPSKLQALKSLKPISYIDSALSKFGVRSKVRDFLNKYRVGRLLTSGADELIRRGYGRRRRHRRRY